LATGRKGNTGTAYTFFTQKNGKNAAQLINILKEANQVVNPKLVEMQQMGAMGYGGGGGRRWGGGGGGGGRGGRW